MLNDDKPQRPRVNISDNISAFFINIGIILAYKKWWIYIQYARICEGGKECREILEAIALYDLVVLGFWVILLWCVFAYKCEILRKDFQSLFILLKKYCLFCATTNCFYPHTPTPAKRFYEVHTDDIAPQSIKARFFQNRFAWARYFWCV